MKRRDFLKTITVASAMGAAGAADNVFAADANAITIADSGSANFKRWWKGNLHTHTHWSDGDHYPEMVAKWYKDNGWHFLAFSDHNILPQGMRKIDIDKAWGGKRPAWDKYVKVMGADWAQVDEGVDADLARVKPMNEFKPLFDEPGKFMILEGEEISDTNGVHLNAINIREVIPPVGGENAQAKLRNNIAAILAQQEKTGQKLLYTINHPNFMWALTAEDIAPIPEAKFIEVYNSGHAFIFNEGHKERVGVERIWDIVLTKRLGELNLGLVYGTAVDDAHAYHVRAWDKMNPGRGWIMVRASHLTPEILFAAMEAGDFYASTGVTLENISFENNQLNIEIKPEDGVECTTQFLGTLKGYDAANKPTTDPNGVEIPTTRIYSDSIGKILAEVRGTKASYKMTGDELYVRAKVISSKKRPKEVKDKFESAWVQPVVSA